MFATTMKDIEKVYCDSYNHDVKAPIVYANVGKLYVDRNYEKPVSSALVEELFYAGVIIVDEDGLEHNRVISLKNGKLVTGEGSYYCFNFETEEWTQGDGPQ